MTLRRRAAGAAIGLFVLFLGGEVQGGTTGKLSGRVVAEDKSPIVAATVLLVGHKIGAFTDAQGKYNVLNIPPGTYQVSVSRLGYETVLFKDVAVSSDQTTWLDAQLREAALTMEEVVVVAQRPPVEINVTSTQATLSTEEIEKLPVQELQDVVNLQAGVVDGHFRGGRQGEVQYQLDGVSMNNAFDNTPTLRVDRSLLQEVQVISGTFDAEYGQAMSGVVNAVLKDGTPNFTWSGEIYGGGFLFPGNTSRLTDDTFHPAGTRNLQLTVSGPLIGPETVYLASGRAYHFDDFFYGTRMFVPTDSSNFEKKVWLPTGDGEKVPLGYSKEYSGLLKLTHTGVPNAKIDYQVMFNQVEGRRANFAYRYLPDGLTTQRTLSFSHGFDWTQTLSPTTFLHTSFRHSFLQYRDLLYPSAFDPRYDAAGAPKSDDNFERGAFIQGADFGRFYQRTNAYLFKTSLVSQVTAENQIKVGGEFQLPEVTFGTPGHLVYTTVDGVQKLVRQIDRPPDFPGPRTYNPHIGSVFAQDQWEWGKTLTLRIGARLDYFDARSTVPSNLANPANTIKDNPLSVPQPTTAKTTFAPRLGLAFPIENRAAVHFAYGHFYQYPSIGTIFTNADYSILGSLQASGVSYGVMGNPDVKAEETVQYEFGYKHAFSQDLGVDVSVFYKDIRNLLGVEFISTYNDAEYARLTNVDFGDVLGFTLSVDHRRLGPASVSLDYTWQQALGNSSDPRETATRAQAGEDPRPRLLPFDWDQHHTLNLTVSLDRPRDYAASMVLRMGSGQPYTPQIGSGFGGGLEANSGRRPVGVLVDLRGEKKLQVQGIGIGVFARVFNVFDTRYFNGFVFNSTGSPFYSRFPEEDVVALHDPTRFYPPRRLEVGLTFRPGPEGKP